MRPFQRKICIGSFELVSTLLKKVVLKAPVSCFYGSSNSDAAVFRNATFGEFKDHSLKRTPFQKKFVVEVLGMQLPYIKKYLQEYQ